jgi:prevent-host-death family protein
LIPHESQKVLKYSGRLSKQPTMHTITADEAKTRFGEFLDRAQRGPVRVIEHDRVVGVVVSAADFEAMRAFYADRLARILDDTAATAARAGLTPEALSRLLADDES